MISLFSLDIFSFGIPRIHHVSNIRYVKKLQNYLICGVVYCCLVLSIVFVSKFYPTDIILKSSLSQTRLEKFAEVN